MRKELSREICSLYAKRPISTWLGSSGKATAPERSAKSKWSMMIVMRFFQSEFHNPLSRLRRIWKNIRKSVSGRMT